LQGDDGGSLSSVPDTVQIAANEAIVPLEFERSAAAPLFQCQRAAPWATAVESQRAVG
jgi:hypothetical protein